MDYKYSNKRKKENQTTNDSPIVPKMILKHSSKESDLQTVETTNHTQPIRLLSPHPNQNSNQKNYEQSYFNQLLGIDVKEKLPDTFNLIDGETWTFKDNFVAKFLSADQPTGPPAYSKIGIIGKQCVGKSALMNMLAGKNAFKTHQTNGNEFLLKHLTQGIDLHITDERVFLLDSQPLMSASILDDLIKSSHVNNHVPQEIVEPEKFVHVTSLQVLSFLITNCDYVIIVNDWLIDLHFLKLISTALMLVGDVNPKADLVFHFKKRFTSLSNSQLISTLQSIFGKGIIVYEDDGEDNRFVSYMFKLCAKKRQLYSTLNSTINVSERTWLLNAKKYWEIITSKSSLHLEYSRFIF